MQRPFEPLRGLVGAEAHALLDGVARLGDLLPQHDVRVLRVVARSSAPEIALDRADEPQRVALRLHVHGSESLWRDACGTSDRRELERHRAAVRPLHAERSTEMLRLPAEARRDPTEEERGLRPEPSAGIRRLHETDLRDALREIAMARVVEEAREHLLPRRETRPREIRDLDRRVLLARPRRDADQAPDRRVLAVEEDALRVVREILEHGILDVHAAEPHERG